ncbi:TSUP family transporter [Paenibacillus alginolyticus]|uniref:Probable membrane transporter protein n=1 Tax=Paenibacillus alginolyticus TaxID=59839 RepID=A0ABT4GMM1_9BACL|nr:TSUP family transporter [Paenibacillus alginolyticus]MCY9665600.1 TSUP family transporter [Paenibacillus alginolyticus]MCY9697269.1 TSUP family transporter [Paenibacillus alginolyticus]MEC0143134.1 TSUP family transporter [Paenibacillus alginolyticus]
MLHVSWEMMIFIIIGGFVAAYVDSVVGGGGLIALPVLLATGLPPAVALGTNKLAGTMSSLTSTISFMRSGNVDLKAVRGLFFLSLLGAVCGTTVLRQIPSDFLKPLVIVMLILITIYTIFRKNWGDISTFGQFSTKTAMLMGFAAFGLGFYDGFFGPGTGSFLIFVFLMLGFNFVKAAGNSKVLNFGSNVASLATFMVLGSINYGIGIPMGIAMVCGSLLGSRMAIRKGSAYVRPLFLTVCIILIGKQIWDIL